jgi:drug/metabolite transporter (DMT)-like permease
MRDCQIGSQLLQLMPRLIYLKLIFVALCWGGTFIAGRVVAQSLPPLMAATGRFAVAVTLLFLVSWKAEGGLPRLTRPQMLVTAALGLTGIVFYNLGFFAALSRMPAGRTALFVALNPIFTALAAALIFRERLGASKWFGILIALIGATIIVTRGDPLAMLYDIQRSIGLGEVFMLCSVASWAAYTIIGRVALKGLTPIAATTYATLWGFGILCMGAVFELHSVDWTKLGWEVCASVIYLGSFGTVLGFVWYYEGVKIIGPSRTAVFTNLVPAFGVVLAWGLLSEPILLSMVVGGVLAMIGVTLTNRSARKTSDEVYIRQTD